MSPVRRTWVPPHSSIDHAGFVAVGFAHGDDADLVAVFLPEQGHRAEFDGGVRGHQAGGDFRVLADAGVHLGLDPVQVQSAVIGRGWDTSKRSRSGALRLPFCCDVGAQLAAQRLVQQVGGGVMGPDAGAAGMIDGGDHGHAPRQRGAGLDPAELHEQVAQAFSACR